MPVEIKKEGLNQIKKDVTEMFSVENMYEIANDAVNFYVDSFNNGGFTDIYLIPWDKGNKENGGATLVLTGQLRNSIRTLSVDKDSFTVISDMEYSHAHNEGKIINISDKMRNYFWAMYKKEGKEEWKWLALTKSNTITIPQRQFMGESQTLNDMIENYTVQKYFK